MCAAVAGALRQSSHPGRGHPVASAGAGRQCSRPGNYPDAAQLWLSVCGRRGGTAGRGRGPVDGVVGSCGFRATAPDPSGSRAGAPMGHWVAGCNPAAGAEAEHHCGTRSSPTNPGLHGRGGGYGRGSATTSQAWEGSRELPSCRLSTSVPRQTKRPCGWHNAGAHRPAGTDAGPERRSLVLR